MLNWGILGTANIARRSVVPAILSVSTNKVIAVGSRNKDVGEAFANEFNIESIRGYQNLLDRTDINAVYIPLPTGMHYEWVMKALEAGKHVLIEKSAITSLQEAKDIVALSRERKLAIVEHFQFQYHSQHKFVKELLKKHEIGEVRCFRASFGFPPFAETTNIRYKKDLGGGALLDAGAYVLKVVSFLFGDGFTVESAYLRNNERYGVDWYGAVQLVNKEKGLVAQSAFGFDNFYQCNYEIWGSKGKITSTRAYTAGFGFEPTIIVEKQGDLQSVKLSADNHFENIQNHFVEIIDKNSLEPDRLSILNQADLIEQVKLKSGIN
jgi:hypothetical protein